MTAYVLTENVLPVEPLDIIGDYNNTPPVPKVLSNVVPKGRILAVKGGKCYASDANNIIKRSDNWGVDGFPTTVATINTATDLYKMLILDNGNILVWDRSGKIFLSTNNFLSFKVVFDMLASPTHDLFGAKAYKNYVMFTEYNNTIGLATKSYISEDYGVTIRECFDIYDQEGFIPNQSTKFHMHDCAIDPFELNSEGKPMLWVSTGDGVNAQMIFFSKDMGETWTQSTPLGYAPTQTTQIIPLKNCVLFLSDSRIVSVLRYNRPISGTKSGKTLNFETAFLIQAGWGKDSNTEVPIGSTSAIDFENSKAYFGFGMYGNSLDGNVTDDSLLKNQAYTTDGYKFCEIYKSNSTTTGAGVYIVYGVDTDEDKSVVVGLDSTDSIRLSGNMWPK